MKLTGRACTEAMSEAEEAEQRKRAEDSAGGVRVELRVRRGARDWRLPDLGYCGVGPGQP